MKFGNYLTEQAKTLPTEYQEACLPYVELKEKLKRFTNPSSPSLATLSSTDPSVPLANVLSWRLETLQREVPRYLSALDSSLATVEQFVETRLPRLSAEETTAMEQFITLNSTALSKILKKLDRHTGIRLAEAFLLRCHPKHPLLVSTTTSTTVPSTITGVASGEKDRVLVTLAGPHGTDIIGAVLEVCARHAAQVDDFMLSRLYHQVTFAVLLTLEDPSPNAAIFHELAIAAHRWDATLGYEVRGPEGVQSIQQAPYPGRLRYAATLLDRRGLSARALSRWVRLLLDERISVERMSRLDDGGGEEGKTKSIDFILSVPQDVEIEGLRKRIFRVCGEDGVDVALQSHDVFRKHKRLVVMDMDSTLIRQEVIDEIARHTGVVDQVAEITAAAMNGEIDFAESLRRRVALLAGTPVEIIDKVRDSLTFTEGAVELCRALKRAGFKLAVISGGFMPLALHVKAILGLDYAFANQLRISPDGRTLTGDTYGPIVTGERKAELLEVIAQAEGVGLEQCVAIGDGANDLWMLARAGLGIAFDAKPKVQEKARTRINQKSLYYVLYLLGYTDEEARRLSE